MENKKIIFIIGIYIAIAVSVSGYLKIDPPEVEVMLTDYDGNKSTDMVTSYKFYRYSVLISIVGLIILYSVLQLFRKEKKK